jgi:hypothetical protein
MTRLEVNAHPGKRKYRRAPPSLRYNALSCAGTFPAFSIGRGSIKLGLCRFS